MRSMTSEIKINKEKLARQLNEWGLDLKKFRSRASRAEGDAKAKFESKAMELQIQLDEGRNRLKELRKAGKAATAELLKGVEAARGKLEKSFEKARAEFARLESRSK